MFCFDVTLYAPPPPQHILLLRSPTDFLVVFHVSRVACSAVFGGVFPVRLPQLTFSFFVRRFEIAVVVSGFKCKLSCD